MSELISEKDWANETWSHLYPPETKDSVLSRLSTPWKRSEQTKAGRREKPRVSFKGSVVAEYHYIPKYAETRSSYLFITHDEIASNYKESDNESDQFPKDEDHCNKYNFWLLNNKATKVARGEYKGRVGTVNLVIRSKVHVKLNGIDEVVCINRSSIEEGFPGSFEDEVYHRSIEDEDDNSPPKVSQTTEARVRRSKRIANRNKARN